MHSGRHDAVRNTKNQPPFVTFCKFPNHHPRLCARKHPKVSPLFSFSASHNGSGNGSRSHKFVQTVRCQVLSGWQLRFKSWPMSVSLPSERRRMLVSTAGSRTPEDQQSIQNTQIPLHGSSGSYMDIGIPTTVKYSWDLDDELNTIIG